MNYNMYNYSNEHRKASELPANSPEVLTNPIYTPRFFKRTNWKTNES